MWLISVLDERICLLCPLGPKGGTSRFCLRCEADILAIESRDAFLAKEDIPAWRSYRYLVAFIPKTDPAA
jgi:hypothetical protein